MIQIFFFLSLLGLLVEPVLGYWRMDCMGIAGIARIDPIVTPGKISAHVHSIKGASGLSDSTTVEQLLASNCTSCPILQDKSAYWTPQMYFHDKTNDSYELVPEVPGHAVYYKYVTAVLNDGKGKTVTDPEPIPNGMRMISGNPFRRNSTVPFPDPPQPWSGDQVTQDALEQKAIGFNCLNYKNPKPEDTCYRHFLPDKAFLDANCPDGLRLEIVFPICWNGKDLDSDDHKSHLAYSSAGINGGNCPSGYDHVINQILLETIIPVGNYRDRQGEFTLENGDPTREFPLIDTSSDLQTVADVVWQGMASTVTLSLRGRTAYLSRPTSSAETRRSRRFKGILKTVPSSSSRAQRTRRPASWRASARKARGNSSSPPAQLLMARWKSCRATTRSTAAPSLRRCPSLTVRLLCLEAALHPLTRPRLCRLPAMLLVVMALRTPLPTMLVSKPTHRRPRSLCRPLRPPPRPRP